MKLYHINLCNDPKLDITIFSYFRSSVFSYWLLCIKLKYSEYSFYYTILQHGLYWDPSKGNVITDSVITASPIAFIFTRYCLLSIFYRFMSNDRNFVWKMYM